MSVGVEGGGDSLSHMVEELEVDELEGPNTPWPSLIPAPLPAQPQPVETENINTPQPQEERKRKAEQLEWMECPVCLETPRCGPIFSCRKGHILCRECQPKVSQCPTCRDRHTDCRSLIAEKLLEATLKDTPVACKYRGSGCMLEDLVVSLVEHELKCMFRSVRCPASHRGACNWLGPLNKLIHHVIQQKCAQVVKAKPPNSFFVSTIGDFAAEQTVFSKSTPTHWKPVMLVSQEALKFFCYAIFYRDAGGYWFAYVRSFGEPAVVKNLRVEIRIGKLGSVGQGQQVSTGTDTFLYGGQVSSSEATEKEIQDSGHFLLLTDSQVLKFKSDKTIMEYNITLKQVEQGNNPPVSAPPSIQGADNDPTS